MEVHESILGRGLARLCPFRYLVLYLHVRPTHEEFFISILLFVIPFRGVPPDGRLCLPSRLWSRLLGSSGLPVVGHVLQCEAG